MSMELANTVSELTRQAVERHGIRDLFDLHRYIELRMQGYSEDLAFHLSAGRQSPGYPFR